ncbi:MAG: hypothetical protein K6T83_16865 [Alicyclobacillus sp.]|nr:hypothetical protein [Alicyclobacillus sp.]
MAKHSYHYWLWRYVWTRAKRRSWYQRRYGQEEIDWDDPATKFAAYTILLVVVGFALGIAFGSMATGFVAVGLIAVAVFTLALMLRGHAQRHAQREDQTRYQVEMFAEKCGLGLQRAYFVVQHVGPEGHEQSTLVSVRDNGILWVVGQHAHGVPYGAIKDIQEHPTDLIITVKTSNGVKQHRFRGGRTRDLNNEIRDRMA